MCPHAGIQLEHLDRHWQDGGGTGGERPGKQGRNSSFISFQCIIFLSLAEMVSSIWNMLIADSAFACWCLTFPLEVAHRLNYSPYLQSVWKHLLSTHTPPPSANPTSAHRILAASVWGGSGAGARRSEQGGGGACIAGLRLCCDSRSDKLQLEHFLHFKSCYYTSDLHVIYGCCCKTWKLTNQLPKEWFAFLTWLPLIRNNNKVIMMAIEN